MKQPPVMNVTTVMFVVICCIKEGVIYNFVKLHWNMCPEHFVCSFWVGYDGFFIFCGFMVCVAGML